MPIAVLVGLPLYLNEFGALPIVPGLLKSGMSSGAAITFLIAGPVTTIPAMAAAWGWFVLGCSRSTSEWGWAGPCCSGS